MVKVQLLAIIVGYWLLLYAFVGLAGSPFEGDFTMSAPPNISVTAINVTGVDSFFTAVGQTVSNAFSIAGFIFFGVGLPDYIPDWLSILFFLWNSFLTMVFIGVMVSFFISS